ncbi:MAG: diguanylate cyclase [Halieaceae bacterium]|nr:diguanylate cyclase [Halieaceae bacterium]
MVDDQFDDMEAEEILGAPPVSSIAEQLEQRSSQHITLNSYLYSKVRQVELMLLEAPQLLAFLRVLLVDLPRHCGFQVSELWLYDPEHILEELVEGSERYGQQLQLYEELFSLQELYDVEPGLVKIDVTDTRMFEVLKTENGIDHAILMPLMDDRRLVGSFHCGYADGVLPIGPGEEDIFAHLASTISLTLKNAISRQTLSRLSLLDPVTRSSNPQGFELHLSREVSRAGRANQSMTLLIMEIDEFDDLYRHYGKVLGQFVLKKVVQRITSSMRATDYIGRLSGSRLAVLLPHCDEATGIHIAERELKDIEDFTIDDGRGAIMYVTLSIGLVTWDPEQRPVEDKVRLVQQMLAAGGQGLHMSLVAKGNMVSAVNFDTGGA